MKSISPIPVDLEAPGCIPRRPDPKRLNGSAIISWGQRSGRLTGFSSNKDDQESVQHQYQLWQYLEKISFPLKETIKRQRKKEVEEKESSHLEFHSSLRAALSATPRQDTARRRRKDGFIEHVEGVRPRRQQHVHRIKVSRRRFRELSKIREIAVAKLLDDSWPDLLTLRRARWLWSSFS